VSEATTIQTFLIADVRGYTLFTQERGDEAAAKLAARFARIAREAVERRGGRVIELRGDEALAVFSSARQAVLAAVDLQERLVEEIRTSRSFRSRSASGSTPARRSPSRAGIAVGPSTSPLASAARPGPGRSWSAGA
jgi:class 3 adenylate cyclase